MAFWGVDERRKFFFLKFWKKKFRKKFFFLILIFKKKISTPPAPPPPSTNLQSIHTDQILRNLSASSTLKLQFEFIRQPRDPFLLSNQPICRKSVDEHEFRTYKTIAAHPISFICNFSFSKTFSFYLQCIANQIPFDFF